MKSYFPVLIFLVAQLFLGIWWASGQTARVSFMADTIVEIKAELKEHTKTQYSAEQAATDKRAQLDLISQITQRVSSIEQRVSVLERKGP